MLDKRLIELEALLLTGDTEQALEIVRKREAERIRAERRLALVKRVNAWWMGNAADAELDRLAGLTPATDQQLRVLKQHGLTAETYDEAAGKIKGLGRKSKVVG